MGESSTFTSEADTAVTSDQIRKTLAQVLGSRSFAGSARHRAFLAAVVNRRLDHPTEEPLKEITLAIEVFGRDASFDPRLDPIVRVEATRLRQRLTQYFQGEGADSAWIIELPKGAYAPRVIPRQEPAANPESVVAATPVDSIQREPPPALMPAAPRWPAWMLVATPLALVAVAALLWTVVRQRDADAADLPDISLAILPLTNGTADAEFAPVTDGLTELLRDQLSALPGLRLTATTSANWFRTTPRNVADIAKALHVGHVLEGEVTRAGDNVTVVLRLTSERGLPVSSPVFQRPLRDSFELRHEMSQWVTTTLGSGLSRQLAQRESLRPSTDWETWDLFAQARIAAQTLSPEGFANAERYARATIARDPAFAPAYVLAANTRMMAAFINEAPLSTADAEEVSVLLDSALRLDARLAWAHTTKAGLALLHRLDWVAARQSYLQALALSPNDAAALSGYAGGLVLQGKAKEGAFHYQQALRADPLNMTTRLLSAAAPFYDGRPRDALALLRELEGIAPNNPFVLWLTGHAQLIDGNRQDAAETFTTLRQVAPAWTRTRVLDALILACHGNRAGAIKSLDRLAPEYGARHPYYLGTAYAWLGEVDSAVHWLRTAIDAHDMAASQMLIEPLIVPIRSDPKFKAVWDAMPRFTVDFAFPGPLPVGYTTSESH